MGADARSARDGGSTQVRLVKDPRPPSRELGGSPDPDRPVVSQFWVGGTFSSPFEVAHGETVTMLLVDDSGNELVSASLQADVAFREREYKNGLAITERRQSLRAARSRGEG